MKSVTKLESPVIYRDERINNYQMDGSTNNSKVEPLEKSESKKAALYARVSTSEAEGKQNPENQLIRLRAYAEAREYAETVEYIDHASGADPNRPALLEMMSDARGGELGAIFIVKLDRIMRSTIHLLEVANDLERWGVALVCLDQPIETNTASGRMLTTIISAVAEFERELIRERTRDGLERARRQGKRLGRPPRDDIDLDRVFRLRAEGKTWREIGRIIGVPHSTLTDRVRKACTENGGSECL